MVIQRKYATKNNLGGILLILESDLTLTASVYKMFPARNSFTVMLIFTMFFL